MKKFAKLFDLEDGSQVVFMIHPVDDEEDQEITSKIKAITECESVIAEMSFNYSDSNLAREMFEDKFNLEKAVEFRKQIIQLFN